MTTTITDWTMLYRDPTTSTYKFLTLLRLIVGLMQELGSIKEDIFAEGIDGLEGKSLRDFILKFYKVEIFSASDTCCIVHHVLSTSSFPAGSAKNGAHIMKPTICLWPKSMMNLSLIPKGSLPAYSMPKFNPPNF